MPSKIKQVRVSRVYEYPVELSDEQAKQKALEDYSKEEGLFDTEDFVSASIVISPLQELINIGKESYKEGVQPNRAKYLGTAIYRYFSESEAVEIAATICEENNFHNLAKKLRGLF